MSTKKSGKKLRGSVLFTVIVVMVVLLIVVLTAIGLAGSASRRAYSTWFDNQTKYTAQDLVDNVIETFKPGGTNAALGAKIVPSLKKDVPKTVKVDVDSDGDGVGDGTYIPGYGDVRSLTFTYVADNGVDYTIPGLTGHNNQKIIKVTAEVFMGGETSTYSTYVVGDSKNNRNDANGGGYIALSSLKGGSGSNDAPATIGRFYAGIFDEIDKTYGGNSTIDAGDVFIRCKEYNFNSRNDKPAGIILGRNDPDNGFYGGMRVTGDLSIDNGLYVQSQYPPVYLNDLSAEKFYNVPYLFVDGALKVKSQGISLVNFDRGGTSTEGLLNLYCDTISVAAGGDLTRLAEGNVNIMITGEGKDNTFKFEDSHLIDWATKTITGVTNKGGINSGNFYCKGNLNNTGKSIDINGDFIVMGNVNTAGEIRVHGGYAYVGGTVTGNVKVDDTYKLLQNIGGSGSTANFLTNLRNKDAVLDADKVTKSFPDAKDAAARFETAFKIKADGVDGVDYVQTHDNILKQFKDMTSGGYKDVVETSDYKGTDVWDGSSTITKSCIWNSTCSLGNSVAQTININPGTEDIWINIAPDLKTISNKTILVDDSQGGSVRFFIENGATTLDFKMTKFVTKTYEEKLLGASPNLTGLSAYPESKMVPQIYMYASSTNTVTITMSDGKYLFTGDLIAPKATFKGVSSNGISVPVKYTYFNYFDINKDGKIDADEQANPVTIDRTMDVMFVGSLEVGNIDVTNLFGYLYVDDPPFNAGPSTLVKDYQWTTLDGYSTY